MSKITPSTKLWAFQSYILNDAQLQSAILNHINAVIGVSGSEERLSLVQLDQNHVTTKFQEERLLEVAEHPGCTQHRSITAHALDYSESQSHLLTANPQMIEFGFISMTTVQ